MPGSGPFAASPRPWSGRPGDHGGTDPQGRRCRAGKRHVPARGLDGKRGGRSPANQPAAIQLYSRAAEAGLRSAQFRLGMALMEGSLGHLDTATGESGCGAPHYRVTQRHRFCSANGTFRVTAQFCRGGRLVPTSGGGGTPAGRPRFGIALPYRVRGGERRRGGARLLRVAASEGDYEFQFDLGNLVLGRSCGAEDSNSGSLPGLKKPRRQATSSPRSTSVCVSFRA